MDLLTQLSLASRALATHSVSVATATHNIDNANTPGYARQRADLSAALPAELLGGSFIGQGVTVGDISQSRDRFLEAQIPAALGSASFSDAQSSTLTSIQSFDPSNPAHIPTTLAKFYSAVRNLGQNASDPSTRRAFVTSAQQLASSFQSAAQELDGARRGVDAQVTEVAAQATQLAQKVAKLNQAVRQARATGGAPNDLLDARHKAVEDLVAATGAQVSETKEGDVNVQTSGVVMVSGTQAATFGTTQNPANRGHLDLTISGIDSSAPRSIANNAVGGTLGGLLNARDVGLANAETKLDTMAFDFANQVNAVHSAGVALDGTGGRNLFTVNATSAGAASSISVNASIAADPSLVGASASGAAGDGAQALSIAGTESQALASGSDAITTAASMIDDFGATASTALSDKDANGAARDQLVSMRDASSGVSIDEEMIEMTKSQRVYEAVGKVITAADDMLKGLLSLPTT